MILKLKKFGPLIITILVGASSCMELPPAKKNNDTKRIPMVFHLKDSIRGSRYCELLVVSGNLNHLMATVYNTLG